MGRNSTKENKSVYQLAREELNLTRAQASEKIGWITDSRLEKIENGKTPIHPDDVIAMSKVYDKPILLNKYCTHDCPIGKLSITEYEIEDLPQITLQILSSLNAIEDKKNKFIEISEDGKISDKEINDLVLIKKDLEKIEYSVGKLKLWIESFVSKDKIKIVEDKLDKRNQ